MAFPNTVDVFPAKVDHVNFVTAADINALQVAIVAIEQRLISDVFVQDAVAGANKLILTRQTGANASAVIRNQGTGTIVIRPSDNAAWDFFVGQSGTVSMAGGLNGVNGFILTAPGLQATFVTDLADGGTPSVNWRAAQAAVANTKILWRLLPTGNGAYLTTGDRAELTLGGDTTPNWWVDRKTRQRISDSVRFSHTLTDSLPGVEPITQYVIELDGSNRSANIEEVVIVRNTFVDGAAGDNQVMFDLKGDVGLIGLAQTKIAINGLKIGPVTAGADISLFLDDGANRTALTRQTGANSDLIVRNFGTGRIVFRPNDVAASDIAVGPTGLTISDARDIILATGTGTKIATAIGQKLGFYGVVPIAQRAGAAQAAVAVTGSTNAGPFGYTTAAQADAIVTLVNELRAWAVAQGFIKGAA